MNQLKDIFAKKVDERQEMDLLRVEHNSFYLMYFLLLIEMVIQGVILDGGDKIFGEWIVFMIVSAFAMIGWLRKGVWNYQHRKVPGIKSHLLGSLAAGVVGGILGFCGGLKRSPGNIPAIMMLVVCTAAGTFVATFVLSLIGGAIARKREKELEMEAIEDDEEDDE